MPRLPPIIARCDSLESKAKSRIPPHWHVNGFIHDTRARSTYQPVDLRCQTHWSSYEVADQVLGAREAIDVFLLDLQIFSCLFTIIQGSWEGLPHTRSPKPKARFTSSRSRYLISR